MSGVASLSPFTRRIVAALAVAAVVGTSAVVIPVLASPAAAAAAADEAPSVTATPAPTSGASDAPLATATSVDVWAQPIRLVADGTSTGTVYAEVRDADGHEVEGATVRFSSSDPLQTFGATEDTGAGFYEATVTSSTTIGVVTITATVEATSPVVSAQSILYQTAGPVDRVHVVLEPTTIIADGVSTTTATITLFDVDNRQTFADSLTFHSSDPGQTLGELIDNEDGTYSIVITSSKSVGTSTITFAACPDVGPEFAPAAADEFPAADDPTCVLGLASLVQRAPVTSTTPPSSTPSTPAAVAKLSDTGADIGWLPFGALAGLVLGAFLLLVRRGTSRA